MTTDSHPVLPRRVSAGSLRGAQLRARVPRLLATVLVTVLCVAGIRTIVSRPTSTVRVVNRAQSSSYDVGAGAFAQSFLSAYLTWGGGNSDPTARQKQLAPFLARGLNPDGGLEPGSGSAQTVRFTAVADQSRRANVTDVVVSAQTTAGTQYWSVPVGRDPRGLLYVAAYPAVVGPPATDTAVVQPTLQPVSDSALQAVVKRSLANYLGQQATNLSADLTTTAVVSLPAQSMTLAQVDSIGWTAPGSALAAQVEVTDRHGDRLTLTYDLNVVKTGRWYVQSIQFDPTLRGR